MDKTVYLEWMLDGDCVCFFITYPHRYGKSVFIQMTREFFLGNEKAFRGLKIHERGNVAFFKEFPGVDPLHLRNEMWKWFTGPVISLDFREFEAFETLADFKAQYQNMIRPAAESSRPEITGHTLPGFSKFDLINKL